VKNSENSLRLEQSPRQRSDARAVFWDTAFFPAPNSCTNSVVPRNY